MVYQEYRSYLTGAPASDELAARISSKFRGRLENFRLESQEGRLVLHGQARSYYVKQLAQEELMELSPTPICGNRIVVESLETE